MGELTLKLFGPLQVRHAGRLLAFPTRKAAGLLVYLAVEGGPQPREKITALFWPESSSERGRATLRKTLAYVRQALAEDDAGHTGAHLSADRESLLLDAAAGVEVDLWTVQAAVEAARAPRPHIREAIGRLAAAAALCTGEFLDGFSLGDAPEFDNWSGLQREAWHRRAGLLYDRLSQLQFDSGDITSAIGTTARWAAHDRMDEGAHRRLMELYAAAGQRAAALEVYETYRATLRRELKAEPGQQTQMLADRIRADDPGLASASKEADAFRPAVVTAAGDAPLIGRASEHHRLAEAFRQARRGQFQVVVLEGEPGIGKTRLARDYLAWAAAQRADVLQGRATESGGRLPYQAVVEALRERFEREADPSRLLSATWLAELCRLLPELADRLPALPSPASSDEAEARTRLYEAVARAGLALGARAPTVVFVDDLHWADPSSLELLQYAARRWASANQPILLLLALRSEELAVRRDLANWLNDMERDLAVARLALSPLGADEARQLVLYFDLGQTPEAGHALSLPGQFEAFTQQLFAETGGQPFFMVQVLRLLAERGLLRRDGAGEWAANPAQAIPASLRELMRGRLSRLSPTAQACGEAGAVLGDGFDFGAMTRLAGLDDREALTALDELLARGLLREAGGSDGPAAHLYFGHDRIREAVYAELSETRRRLLHRAALSALGEAASPSQLARHALAGGLPEAALQHYLAAGEEAMRLFAVRSAVGHYERALALLGDEAPGAAWPAAKLRQQANVQRKLGECLQLVSDYPAALAAFGAAGEGFARAGEQTLAGAIQRTIGRVYWERGERARALIHYQRALAMLEGQPKQRGTWRQRLGRYQQVLAAPAATPESVELARTISTLSQMHMLTGELDAVIVHGERALAMARRLEAADVVQHALLNLGTAHSQLGRPDLGLPLLQESLAMALRAGSVHDACRAYTNTAEVLSLILCRHGEARALLQEMLSYATSAQAVLFIGAALYDLALIDWLTGQWSAALASCERLRDWMDSHEVSVSKVWASMLLGRIENDLGRPEHAWTILEAELPRARSLDDMQSTVPHLAQLARAYQAGGRPAEAQVLMREYLAQVARTTAYDPTANATLLFACQWYAAQRTPAGLDTARQCLGWLEQTSAGQQRPATLAAWHEAQGSVALASGEATLAAEQLAQAAERWAAIGHPYDQMRALTQLSQARQQAGEAAGAAAAQVAALALVQQLAAHLPSDDQRGPFVRAATSWTGADG